ncbi:hypothetical protein BDZ94DRAFT_1002213 [Collybia nuda]|uniref:RING-type domain-containing protein n=1 Tax=Collybia nuda TaxID=64659 RepID=A0A9P6CEZ5_9AGAR|nr:hypothetical protein BDZ94DRAFT_1002213 [Collybia nuda]
MLQPILPPSPTVPPPPPAPEQSPQHLPHPNADIDSDDSLEIIDRESVPDLPSGPRLEEDVKRDWKKRRGVEFPPPRGRTKIRGSGDSDTEQDHSPPESPKKHQSLSPLRTFFPYRPMNIPERAMSAHPSPGSSPYSYSRSAFPFLSTTSLKMTMSTSSLLRIPLTPTSDRRNSFFARTLSSFKGKDRERHESLDTWEVVESEPQTPILLGDAASRVKNSPTRSQSFTYGSPIEKVRPVEPAPISPPPTPNSMHPLSLRDRKAPPVPVVKRPKKHRPAPPPPAPVPVEPVPLGPVLTSVRTRKPPPPPPKKNPQAIVSSPLGSGSWKPDDVSEAGTAILQRALEIPLPLTPVDARFDYGAASSMPIIKNDPLLPLTPTHPLVSPPLPTSAEPRSPTKSPFDELAELIDQPIPRRNLGDLRPGSSTPASPLTLIQNTESGASLSKRHYPGRPLPRPPGATRPLVDSTYAGNGDCDEFRIDVQCPEGLLIDLDDTSLIEHSGCSTPQTDRSQVYTHTTPSGASSVEFLGSTTDSTLPSHYEGSTVSTPVASLPPTAQYSEFTDLDMLVSRLNEEQRNGSDYDALVMLSEFIGPASPVRTAPGTLPTSSTPRAPVTPGPNDNVPLIGSIEVERRRVTKDGRTKLKLLLIDASVDKCGICHVQFKGNEMARLGSLCRHAFHDKCLSRWLVRSRTCPMCRAKFVDTDHL